MSQITSFNFKVQALPSINLQKIQDLMQKVLQDLTALVPDLSISLFHDYEPRPTSNLTSYLLFQPGINSHPDYNADLFSTLLNKGDLGGFFHFQTIDSSRLHQAPDWVEYVGEIQKSETFLEEYSCYLPYPFVTQVNSSSGDWLETLTRLDRPARVYITLQPFANLEKRKHLLKSIDEMVRCLQSTGSHLPSYILHQYQSYQRDYTAHPLFRYSIQVFTQQRADAILLQNALGKIVENSVPSAPYSLLKKGETGFAEALQAAERFVPTTQIEHPGWQSHAFLQLPIKKALKPPRKSTRSQDDLLSCLPGEDTSLSIDRLLSQLDFNKALQQKNLLDGSDPFLLASQAQNLKSGDLSLGGSSALDSLRNPPPICFTDLKPLHCLVTLPEVTGFLQLASPASFKRSSTQEVATVGFPDRLTIQDIIDRYGRNGKNLITEAAVLNSKCS